MEKNSEDFTHTATSTHSLTTHQLTHSDALSLYTHRQPIELYKLKNEFIPHRENSAHPL